MAIDALLSRLENVKRTGTGRWIARCPAHEDRRASLSIRELNTGIILLHDFASCSVNEVLAAIGLEMSALFPERELSYSKRERRPFNAADVLRCTAFEALVVATAAANIAGGVVLTPADLERLKVASARLQAAAGAFHD
jgi:hypothetical protein